MPDSYKTKINFLEILHSSGSLKIKIIKLIDYSVGSLIAFLVPAKKTFSLAPNDSLKRVLIIRPGGMGDAIFLIPLLRSVKKRYPSLIIDILCEQRNRQAFVSQPDTHDHLYCYDELKSFSTVLKNKYGLVIDTEQWHYLSALIAYFLTLPSGQTIGFATRALRAKLFHQPTAYRIDAYELENFTKLFRSLLMNQDSVKDINNSFRIKENLLEWALQKIPSQSVSLFVGASIPERRLTLAQSLELIRFILGRNFSVILLGGNDVLATGKELKEKISDPRLLNFVGKISLEQSAALIKTSKLFIGTDSGLMHLACAVGTPTIAIFGPGNLNKWSPQGTQHTVITENAPCSPCTHYGYTLPTCNGSYFCMRDIKIKYIVEKITNYLIPG